MCSIAYRTTQMPQNNSMENLLAPCRKNTRTIKPCTRTNTSQNIKDCSPKVGVACTYDECRPNQAIPIEMDHVHEEGRDDCLTLMESITAKYARYSANPTYPPVPI